VQQFCVFDENDFLHKIVHHLLIFTQQFRKNFDFLAQNCA